MKLELPYQKHLAFANNEQFRLASTYDFESAYDSLKNREVVDPKESQKHQADCFNAIEKIFEDVLGQSTVVREKLFVEDLKRSSVRVLKDDIDAFLKRKTHTGSQLPSDKKISSSNDYLEFSKKKFLQGKISDQGVKRINNLISGLVVKFRENAKNGKTTREELSVNTGITTRLVTSVLNSEFRKSGILDVLSEYMGVEMCARGVAIELSVPNANWWKVDYTVYSKPPKTLYFHFDESMGYPKAIVYLTDVTERTGATSCAPSFAENANMTNLQFLIGRAIIGVGKDDNPELKAYYNHKYHQTFGCPLFKQDFSKLPDEMRFSSHFGWDVIPDSPLESFLLQDERKIIGSAGTFIAFDGCNLLHRGGMLVEGDRVALQVSFGEKHSILKRAVIKSKKIVKHSLSKFVKNDF
jgi:hypothetical protein